MSEAPYAPAEPPADGDRTSQVPPPGAPRYSASASVPVPPANNPPSYGTAGPSGAFGQVPPPQPTTYGQGNTYGQGSTYGQGATYGQPASQAPMGQAPMGQMGQPAMGQPNPAQANPAQPGPVWSGAGAAASGSYAPAPAAPATYGAASPGYQAQAQPGVYGQQQGGTQYGQPQPAGQFGQAQPPAGGQYGQPQGGGQFGQPQQGGQYGQPQTPPAFQPAPAQPQAYGQPQYGAPQQPPQQPPQQGRDKMVPTGGWPYVEQSEVPPAPKSRKGLTIFLIILAVLVVAGVGGYVGLRLANRSDVFVEGACVRQDGNGAEAVECGASGAYKITRIVETEDDCPDPTQPSLLLSDGDRSRVACLGPATP